MVNLFFAVLPSDAAKAQMSKALETATVALDPSARRIPANRLHVSVQGLGEFPHVPDALLTLARRMGARVEAPAFEVSFDRVLGFNAPDGHSVVLTGNSAGAEFKKLRRAICAEMQLAGMIVKRDLTFAPHVTLAYQKTRIEQIVIRPVRWIVSELVLIKSARGRHVALDRWPLWC